MNAAIPSRSNIMKEAINVICRVRPLNEMELMRNNTFCIQFVGPNSLAIGGRTFTYDAVLQPSCTQTEVYEQCGKSIVDSVLNGYNGTIFTYGQTASGKTYTMEGKLKDPEHKGIIPRIIEDIFLHIERMDENLEFLIKGATERFVSSADDVLDALDEGKINRHVSVTNMNEHSSRSHSIFIISIQQNHRETGKQLSGSLYLVDLAGSEKVSKTLAEGSLLDEAKNINKSLSTLGNVINALVEGNNHVPYRDSKLTRILQQSLGGNSKTTIIIAVSPSSFNEAETKSTLIFGVRAKSIKNQVTLNAVITSDEWQRLFERESERKRNLLSIVIKLTDEIKRWRNGEKVPKDEWYGEDNYAKLIKDLVNEQQDHVTSQVLPESSSRQSADLLSPTCTSPNAAEVVKPKASRQTNNDERIQELFRTLDEKDDEINKQSQLVARLENQLVQIQNDYSRIRKENEKLQDQLDKAQRAADISRSEIKDVLQALEDLAVTYDEKNSEAKKLTDTVEYLTNKVDKLKAQLELRDTDLKEMKEYQHGLREKIHKLLLDLTYELGELGERISPHLVTRHCQMPTVEEQAAGLKLFIMQFKSEIDQFIRNRQSNALNSKYGHLNQSSREELADESNRKIQELKALIAQSEDVIRRHQEDKQKLKVEIQAVNKELLKFKANHQLMEEIRNVESNNEQLFGKLQSAIEKNATHYQEQIDRAYGDSERIVNESERLKKENTILKLQSERFYNEIELLRKQLNNPEGIQTDETQSLREQADLEIKAMEDTVIQELQALHTLRKVFLTDLRNRIRKSTGDKTDFELDNESLESQSLGSAIQREKISFLKSSLDSLTKVHKQLVRDNAELRCDIPKLEKRVKAGIERIKDLEIALREGKEQMIRDKKRYLHEVERIKEAAWARGSSRMRTNICKPIRAGQSKD